MPRKPRDDKPDLQRRVLVAGAAASIVMPRLALAQGNNIIRIGVPTKTYWPTIVAETAIRQKLFDKEGIKAELTIYRSGAEGFEALAAGAADLILNSSSSVAAGLRKGVNVRCVANGANGYYGWYLVVKTDSPVKDFKELAGKKVGITSAGSGSDICARWTSAHHKLEFTRVPLGGGGLVPNLLTGNIDATVLYSPLTFKVIDEKLARSVDNAHLLMCDVAASALSHAGYDPLNLTLRNTGVYIGHAQGSSLAGDHTISSCMAEAAEFLREVPGFARLPADAQEAVIREFVERVRSRLPRVTPDSPDVSASLVAGTISKAFGLSGPYLAINSACASSLQAMLLGARALQMGRVDMAIQRFMDILLSFPIIVLALAVVAVLGKFPVAGLDLNLIVAIAIPMVPKVARVVRASALAVREMPYIDAARAAGYSDTRIMFRHIVPNVTAPYLIMFTAYVAQAILLEASLSFLGLGVTEPTAAWGLMLSGSSIEFYREAPWMIIFPGLAISLAVFAFNLFGDSLRDWLDPKIKL